MNWWIFFLDLTRGCRIPAGSVVLISSLTHLADVGLGAYAEDIGRAASKIGRVFQGGLVSLPGLIIPPQQISDPVLTRQLFDVIEWSKTVSKLSAGGHIILDSCLGKLAALLKVSGTGGEQAEYGARYRLPGSLSNAEYVKWDTRGQTGLKNSVGPLPTSDVVNVLNTALSDLNRTIGLPLLKVAGLSGATVKEHFNRRVIIVGASHARRLSDIMSEDAIETSYIETPTFRLMSKDIGTLTESIRSSIELSLDDDVVLVLNVLDNTFFVAKSEDWHFWPIKKDLLDGKYHVNGDIACSPVETSKQLLNNLFPLLKAFQNVPKVILVPLPRYLYGSCCTNEEHVPSLQHPNHVADLVQNLDSTHKLWRGMIFRERVPLIKVCNTTKILEDRQYWAQDPVHPSPEGYRRVASYVL
jgi:hypothetical protein